MECSSTTAGAGDAADAGRRMHTGIVSSTSPARDTSVTSSTDSRMAATEPEIVQRSGPAAAAGSATMVGAAGAKPRRRASRRARKPALPGLKTCAQHDDAVRRRRRSVARDVEP